MNQYRVHSRAKAKLNEAGKAEVVIGRILYLRVVQRHNERREREAL